MQWSKDRFRYLGLVVIVMNIHIYIYIIHIHTHAHIHIYIHTCMYIYINAKRVPVKGTRTMAQYGPMSIDHMAALQGSRHVLLRPNWSGLKPVGSVTSVTGLGVWGMVLKVDTSFCSQSIPLSRMASRITTSQF